MENRKGSNWLKAMTLSVIMVLLLAACQAAGGAAGVLTSESPAKLVVSEQSVSGGQVVISEVDSPAAGWVVVYADDNGSLGAVLGHTFVTAGVNKDVVVLLADAEVTPLLHAVLHTDGGQLGMFEFPGADTALNAGNQMVASSFSVMTSIIPATTNVVSLRIDGDVHVMVNDGSCYTSQPAFQSGC